MAQLNYHPAPGMGDLLPGFYVVPQNPVQPVKYIRGISEILPGSFPVPQNPVKDYTSGQTKLIGQGVSGCGCGGSCGGCGGGQINGIKGLGDFTTDYGTFTGNLSAGNYMAAIQSTFFGVPVWAIGGALVLVMFAGGQKHSYVGRGRRAARAAASAF
jgi:hypothetical protein